MKENPKPPNLITSAERGPLQNSPLTSATISPSLSSPSAGIPLRSIPPTSSRRLDDHSASAHDEKTEIRPSSSDSDRSDFSLWSDTGDLAEQLADEEDPLRISLQHSVDRRLWAGSAGRARGSKPHQVRHVPQDRLEQTRIAKPGVDKEAIEIPIPRPRIISRTEKVLATVMTGDMAASQTHGLVGKPLL